MKSVACAGAPPSICLSGDRISASAVNTGPIVLGIGHLPPDRVGKMVSGSWTNSVEEPVHQKEPAAPSEGDERD